MNKINLDRLHMVLFQTTQKLVGMKYIYKHRSLKWKESEKGKNHQKKINELSIFKKTLLKSIVELNKFLDRPILK